MIPFDTTALLIGGKYADGFLVLAILGAIAGASFAVIRFGKRNTIDEVSSSQTMNFIKPDTE